MIFDLESKYQTILAKDFFIITFKPAFYCEVVKWTIVFFFFFLIPNSQKYFMTLENKYKC